MMTFEGGGLAGASVRVECRNMDDEPLDRDIPADEMTQADDRIVIRGESGTAFGACTDAADSSRPFRVVITTATGSQTVDLSMV